jgi:hypothetical protein
MILIAQGGSLNMGHGDEANNLHARMAAAMEMPPPCSLSQCQHNTQTKKQLRETRLQIISASVYFIYISYFLGFSCTLSGTRSDMPRAQHCASGIPSTEPVRRLVLGERFSDFLQSLQLNPRRESQVGHCRFLSYPFKFIVQLSS